MVNRLSGTGSWWQVRATGMCRYPGALGVSLIAGSRACLRFSKRLGCLLGAGEIPPHREPVVQVLDVIGLTL
jgi:hypothetical protein